MTTPRIRSLGEQSSTGTLVTGVTSLAGVQIRTNGTADGEVVLYDNTSAAGKVVFDGACVGADLSKEFTFERPVKCKNGLHLVLTGTGASCIVYTG